MATAPSTSYHQRTVCRLCDSPRLERVISLSPTPPADKYVTKEELKTEQPSFPLDLDFCLECGHLQLVSVVNPDILFRKYIYVTSSSLGLVDHFRKYALEIIDQFKLKKDALIVEMGSNEGALLRAFKEKGHRVLGVDPAKDIAQQATASGVETWAEFFNEQIAAKIRKEKGPAEIVLANNVFAHSDELGSMAKGAFDLLSPTGTFIFEVGYLGDIVDKYMWDTVYHEHLSYHSIAPLRKFLNRYGMELVDIQRHGMKGGSFRAFAQRLDTGRKPSATVMDMIANEKKRGYDNPDTYKKVAKNLQAIQGEVKKLIDRLVKEGKTIVGYGASPSTTTLLYYFGLGNVLKYIVDDNPLKQGRFSPGAHIPIRASDVLVKEKPDYVFLFAWMYSDPIFKRNKSYIDQGGRFILPLPEVKISPVDLN
jgi:hypothetical protein